jgi:hypothetical protein
MYCIYKIIIICILLSSPILYYVCCYFNDKFYIHFGGSLEHWIDKWMNECDKAMQKESEYRIRSLPGTSMINVKNVLLFTSGMLWNAH